MAANRNSRVNEVWCADISYIPLRLGFLYLMAVMDWFSRKVLYWRLSNTMDADFCVDELEEALARLGKPEIFNTDHGSQFNGDAFTNVLKEANVRISMDGKGRWRDNIMIERLWLSLKYECIYLHAFETGSEVRHGIKKIKKQCCPRFYYGIYYGTNETGTQAYRLSPCFYWRPRDDSNVRPLP